MADRLKLGLFGLHRGSSTDPDVLVRRAQRAEACGFESLWVGDHIALPVGSDPTARYPAHQSRLEALTALTFLAAVTSTVRLGVGVIVLPQRQPVLLAKQLSSLDVLAKGRLIVGIGVGYVDTELRALGASLADRGARTDEYLAVMRRLWDEPNASFGGNFVAFDEVVQRPRPVQRPHPPIVVGGQSAAAYRRTIESADGWYGFDLDLQQTAQALADLRTASSRYSRGPGLRDLEITITPHGQVDLDAARRYADLGVHRLALQPPSVEGSAMDELIESTADTLIGRLT